METLTNLIVMAHASGHKVLICGNGGLAAESEHFAAELMGKFGAEVFIPCIALTSNSSLVTALANDYGYREVFAHQVRALANPGDVLIAMTTSASENVVEAIMEGNRREMHTVCLCGTDGPSMAEVTVMSIGGTARVQESILNLLHKTALDAKRELK